MIKLGTYGDPHSTIPTLGLRTSVSTYVLVRASLAATAPPRPPPTSTHRPEELVELAGPPLLPEGGLRLLPEGLVLAVVVPVGGLQDGVVPEVVAEHLLEEADHAAQRGRHPVVLGGGVGGKRF